MTARTPVKYDGTNIVEMSTADILEWKTYIAYLYAKAPTVTVTVVSSGGTLTPASMTDTRMAAGAAAATGASSYVGEGSTAEPSVVTGTTYDKITGPTYDTSGSAASDLGVTGYPLYVDSNNLRAMTQADYVDTFIYPTLDGMVSGTESAATNGTYTITTSATPASNYTLVSATAVFVDTRANTGAYTAAGIPETLDQPTNITSYYVHRRSDARAWPSEPCLFAIAGGDIQQGPLSADSSTFNATLENDIQYYAAEDSTGKKLSYNINGSGNSRGTAIVDTRLNGSGNYQQYLAGEDDYRAQEFPNGSGATINTWTFKVEAVASDIDQLQLATGDFVLLASGDNLLLATSS